ncbi:LPD38 domain-containing protein [Bradyrhizobium japonicum]|uniref:LPD38 domain-containing protein n=1 Tax=Bradyrhizobium japonicum TaxID=375 RepID=UPI0018AD5EE4|nr:LPD38 domain-containing protein [Bradyrhizobium japonicum]
MGAPAYKKALAYAVGAGIGSTEAIGLGRIADKLDKKTGGGLKRYFGLIMKEMGEEGLQEAGQQLLDNLAKLGLYGKDPGDITAGVAQAALVGMILGGGMAGTLGLGNLTAGRDRAAREGVPTPEQAPITPEEIIRQILGESPTPPQTATPPVNAKTQEEIAGSLQAPQPESVTAPSQIEQLPVPPQASPTTPTAPNSVVGADENSAAPISVAPAPEVGNAPNSGSTKPLPTTNPASAASDEDIALLRGYGYDDQQIADMSPAQIAAEVAAAQEAGTEPVFGEGDAVVGSRAEPVKVETPADLDRAAGHVNTSPTEAQKEAGTYAKGHVKWNGLDITIETPKGAERSGKGANGESWSIAMPGHYGYIRRTVGKDGDQVDVTFGDDPKSSRAFIVDQFNPETGRFDEHKLFVGYPDLESATLAYDLSFSDGSGPQRRKAVSELSVDQLKGWLRDGNTKKAYSEDVSRSGQNADVQALAQREGSLPQSQEPVLPQLRGAGDQTASGVGEQLSGLPGRSGAAPVAAAHAGPEGQREGLRAGQRGLGDQVGAGAEHAQDMPADVSGQDAVGTSMGARDRAASENGAPQGGSRSQRGRSAVAKLASDGPALSLLQFIASKGGLRPDPELTAIGLSGSHRVNVPGRNGRFAAVRPTGMSIDQMREAAEEAGYFRGTGEATSTPREFLDAIDNELRGQRRLPEGQEAEPSKREMQRLEEENANRDALLGQNRAEIEAMLEAYGVPAGMTNEADLRLAAEIMADEGLDPDAALERAAIRNLENDPDIPQETVYDAFDFGAFDAVQPEPTPEDERGAEAESAAGVRPGEEGRVDEPVEHVSGAGEDREGPGEGEAREEAERAEQPREEVPERVEPVTERTEAGEQAVLPGAEKESQGKQAKRKADAALKPKAAQKPADEGLFGDDSKQTDLLDIKPTEQARESGPSDSTLADVFAKKFVAGEKFTTILAARKLAKETTGIEDAKAVEEQIELGVVRAAREIVQKHGDDALKVYPELVALYAAQPKLGTRTSTSMRDQAFSTPVPLAYIASRLAGVAREDVDVVYEPTAGNGALLIETTPEQTVIANEINPARAQNLETFGFNVTKQDAVKKTQAASINAAFDGATVVIANPPFGAMKEGGQSTIHDLSDIQPGYKTTQIDHAIALRALAAMRDDGRATLIVGGLNKMKTSREARSDGYNGKDKREFYKTLYDRYNVTDHFTVAGELYERQGAGWPVDVIVIDGRGKSARKLPAVDVPRVYASWDQLGELLNELPSDEATTRGQDGAADPDDVTRGSSVPDARGGAVDGGSRSAARPAPDEPAGVLAGSVPEQSGGNDTGGPGAEDEVQPGGRGDAGRPDPAPAAQRRAPRVEQETERQVAYAPRSARTQGLGTLVPVNMRKSLQGSLDSVAEKVGDIDAYVASELGYKPDELASYFGAEQIDALALAISNLLRGKGFIIGDQTGIGKGRVNAAIIRWAIKNNRIPVFVTEKPNLYGDMYRDLNDIGISDDFLSGPPRILATNADLSVPMTDDGKVVLKTPSAKVHNADLSALTASNFFDKYDMVFTNYSQMQTLKGENTPRRGFLSNIIHNAVLIFDESHNAGGQDQTRKAKGEKADRAGFARELVSRANGVFYSSATYAKRPEVMDLYAATDMSMAVEKPSDLGEAISKGGVPMQQVVATMLAQAGQYVRRERSFAGVTYDTPLIDVDREAYDGISRSLAAILDFSDHVKEIADQLDEDLKGQASGTTFDNSVGDAGAKSVAFTSVMHNIINQMLLAMKADGAAQRAIEALKEGKKPVITLASTMESFLKNFADDTGIAPGSVINADFGDVLRRYLDRTRTVLIKKPYAAKGEVERKYLSDKELGKQGRASYDAARRMIDDLALSHLPVSPIDAIKQQIRKAGYTVGEITGRGTIVDYSGDEPILKPRPGREMSIRGRRETISDFNSGKLDAVILNQAGATGLSLHASEKFKDQRQRKMIIAQAEANIDTHMQMLGRVHRTGQVVTPEYDQLVAGIPAEKRPAAVLAKKMASLNANTTASRGGALTAKDVPDFINQYGDMVAAMYILENPDMNRRLGEPIKFKDNGGIDYEDAMRKITGRIPLLPLAEQESLYEHLEAEYDALLKQMEASGENALEAKTYDLKAKTLESTEVVPAKGETSSPFAAPVNVERVSAVRLGKPFPSHEVVQKVYDAIAARDNVSSSEITKENAAERYKHFLTNGEMVNPSVALAPFKVNLAEFDQYRRRILDDIDKPDIKERERVKLDAVKDRWTELIGTLPIGARVTFKTSTGNMTGIILGIEQKGQPKNPLALSSWKVTAAISDATRQVTVPVSRMWPDGKADTEDPFAIEVARVPDWLETPAQTLERFDTMQSEAREERFIATGNLLAAYDWLNKRGRIINYTDDEGHIRQGILTASDFDLDNFAASKPVVIESPREVVNWLQTHKGQNLWSRDHVVRVSVLTNGKLIISTDSAKKTGGIYYLDRELTNLTGDFFKTGGIMRAETWGSFEPAIGRLQRLGAVFEAPKEPETKTKGARASLARMTGEPTRPRPLTPETRATLEHALTDVVRKITGPSVAVRFVDEHPINMPAGWGSFGQDKVTAAGSYIPARALITVALADPAYPLEQVLDTTFHEAFHALEDKILTEQEMDVLKREDARLREIVKRAYGFTAEQISEIAGFEIRAMAFEYYASRRARGLEPQGLHIGIRRAFERLMDLFRRVRNALNGLGYRNASDIFEAAFDGAYADRRAAVTQNVTEQANIRPPQVRPQGNLNRFESYEPLPERWQDWWKRPDLNWRDRAWGMLDAAFLRANRALGDRYVDMRRLQAAVELTGRQVNEGVNMALAATLFEGRTEKRLKDYWTKLWKPALDFAYSKGITREELHRYLYARHAPERNAHIAEINPMMPEGGSGMTDTEAQEIMDGFAAAGKLEALEQVAQRIDTIVRKIRSMMVDDQLEHEEIIGQWEQAYQHYVPLRGFESGDEDMAQDLQVSRTGKGFDVRGPETKQALGRSSKADDILTNLFLMGERTIIRGEQNRVGRTAMRFMQSNPQPSLYEVSRSERVLTDGRVETTTENDLDLLEGERPITVRRVNRDTGLVETVTRVASGWANDSFAVKVGGHTYYIRIKHPGLLTALKNVGIQRLPMVIQWLSWLTRQFSAFRTARNPDFFVPNLFRDVQDAAYTLGAEQRSSLVKNFALNIGSLRTYVAAFMGELMEKDGALGDLARRKFADKRGAQLYEDWKKHGGQIAFMGISDMDSARREIEAAFHETEEGYAATVAKAPYRLARSILKAIEFFNGAIEAGTRLAVYDAGLKAGMTKNKAAELSKESTTNFNRKGIYSPYLNAFYAFFNARVQGATKIIRLLRNSKMARRAAIGLVIGGFSTTLWNLAVSPDDEDKKPEYMRRKYWERERYFIFYIPGAKDPIRIPMGYGLQLFWMLGENLAMASQGKITPAQAAANYLSTIVSAFSPVQAEGSATDPGTWLRYIMPSMEMPLLELGTNEDWRRKPIHPKFGKKGEPHSEQHFTTTSPYAIDVAQFLNKVSGGNAFKPGAVDFYPGDLQYIWNFATGGLGQTTNRTTTLFKNWMEGVPTPPNQVPILRHFVGANVEQATGEAYYEARDEVQRGMAQVRKAMKAPAASDDAATTIEEGGNRYGLHQGKRRGTVGSDAETIFRNADKQLKGLRALEQSTRQDKTMDSKARSEAIAGLRQQMREVQEQARKAYREIKKREPTF